MLNKEIVYPIKILYYEDGNYEYLFNNDQLQRVTIYEEFTYGSKDDILSMFGLRKYSDTEIKDINTSYRASNTDIHDFWIYSMDKEKISGVKITYSTMFD